MTLSFYQHEYELVLSTKIRLFRFHIVMMIYVLDTSTYLRVREKIDVSKKINMSDSQSSIHDVAAQGFERGAECYEQARPSYPEDALRSISDLYTEVDVIVDLGAGTGKLTQLLSLFNAREIIAIEPVKAMREKLTKISTIHQILDGTAEKIPLPDNSVDIIFCAQAFHWFANHRALSEIHRVLKSNGLFVLIWNELESRDDQAWQDLLSYIDSFTSSTTPRYKTMQWKECFENQTFFSSLEHRQWNNNQRVTREMLINRVLSTSFISILSNEQQENIRVELGQRFDTIFKIPKHDDFDFLYVTNVYWCSALKL